MNRFDILKTHRRLSIWAAVAFLVWACSGLLHPVMTWTTPRPVVFTPPPVEKFAVPSLNAVKQALGDRSVTNLRILSPVMQADGVVLDLKTGKEQPEAGRDHAVGLARYYSADASDVKSTTLITVFDSKYPYINRFLPAWRVEFADGQAVYVETFTDRVGSITDRLKIVLQTVFENVHTLKFLESVEPLRVTLIASLVGSLPLMAIMGVYLRVAIRRKAQGARRLHRVLALIVALPLLAFSISGLFHLTMQSTLVYDAPPAATSIAAQDMRFMPRARTATDLRLVDGWWRMESGDVTYMNAKNGETLVGDEAFARALAARWGAGSIKTATLVQTFTPEYGFANKRLPVWRIEPETGPLMFIEPRTATLAAIASPAARAETWTFANLHKWQFFKNHTLRDTLMIFTVLLGVAGILAGLRLRLRKKAGF